MEEMQNLAQHCQKFSGQPKLNGTLLQKQNNWMPIIPVLCTLEAETDGFM